MTHMPATVLIAFVFTVVTLASGPARPCSPAMPSLHGPISPADGATGVPLNGRIVIATSLPPPSFEARLFGPGDDEGVPLPGRAEARHVSFELADIVEPDTEYLVVFSTLGDEAELTGEREPLSFTTAGAVDDESPELVDDPTITAEYRAAAPLGPIDSCGGGVAESWSVRVTPPSASDDVEVAGFRLLRREGAGVVERSLAVAGSQALLFDSHTEGGTYVYVVEAFDLAGNTVRSVDVDISLHPFVGGCSATGISSQKTPTVTLSLLFGLALLVPLSRRRRRAPSQA